MGLYCSLTVHMLVVFAHEPPNGVELHPFREDEAELAFNSELISGRFAKNLQ